MVGKAAEGSDLGHIQFLPVQQQLLCQLQPLSRNEITDGVLKLFPEQLIQSVLGQRKLPANIR